MAIYHLHAKIVSRGAGRSVVAAAAYRAGAELRDEQVGLTFDYTKKSGVDHAEILAPDGAPAWVIDRGALWNAVEAVEKRKDAQLAREIEVALPIELTKAEQVALVRDFAMQQFVAKGMVVDLAVHRDNPDNPHAHLLLTTRQIGPDGFGAKRRDWNDRAQLEQWREAWATLTNEHLLRAGHDVRIDHRTLEAQGSELTPGRKLGIGVARQDGEALPRYLADRVAESRQIAADNGARIVEDPAVALRALTHQHATFTHHDVAKFLHGRTEGAEQFQAAYLKVTTHDEVVRLGTDERGRERYTTREMLGLERGMLEAAERLAGRDRHGVSAAHREAALRDGQVLSAEQEAAFGHVTGNRGLALLVGVAGAGKSTLLEKARVAWEAEGLTVRGAALSGIAAENLEAASGIRSRTLASWSMSWAADRDPLTSRDVLVIDEAGMVGTRQLAAVLERAEVAGAKVVLVGDPEQLQAIEAGAPFRGIAQQAGLVELTEVRRQRVDWQREATQALSRGQTGLALARYEQAGLVVAVDTQAEARAKMIVAWRLSALEQPEQTRLLLAYRRDEVRLLNEEARALRLAAGELGHGEVVETERGTREFAAGDRLYFLKNDRALGVKNGSIGTVERIEDGVLQVRLDGVEERRLAVDSRFYNHLDHGYAATVHKSQGVTVDQTFVLASRSFDRHVSYVALSRHRESVQLYYGWDEFRGGEGVDAGARARANLDAVLGRARPKELAMDYLELASERESGSPRVERVLETAERSADLSTPADAAGEPGSEPARPLTMDERAKQAREQWLAYRQAIVAGKSAPEARLAAGLEAEPSSVHRGRELDVGHDVGRDDDFSL